MWGAVRRFVRTFVSSKRCVECGQTDSTVQWATGSRALYVCPTCIQTFDYPSYMPSLTEDL
jgi:transposase